MGERKTFDLDAGDMRAIATMIVALRARPPERQTEVISAFVQLYIENRGGVFDAPAKPEGT